MRWIKGVQRIPDKILFSLALRILLMKVVSIWFVLVIWISLSLTHNVYLSPFIFGCLSIYLFYPSLSLSLTPTLLLSAALPFPSSLHPPFFYFFVGTANIPRGMTFLTHRERSAIQAPRHSNCSKLKRHTYTS